MPRRNAWLTPDDTLPIAWSARCLNIPEPLYPAVTGALALLTETWNWEQFGTMTPEDAAQLATVMLAEFSDECGDMGCSDVIECLISAGLLNTIPDDRLKRVVDGIPQYSFDNGATWIDIPLNGDGEPYVPALTPTAGIDDAAKICLAATRASLVINELYGGVFGALGAGIHNALNTFSAFLRDLNSALLGLIYGEGWQILNAEILRDTDLTTNYVAPSLAQGVIDDLRCLLVSEATVTSTGVVIFDYSGVRDNVIAATNLVDGAAIWGLLGYIAEQGLNAAGATHITDTPADCSCGDCDYASWAEHSFYWLPENVTGVWFGTASNYTGGRTPDSVELRSGDYVEITFVSPVCVYSIDFASYSSVGATYDVYADAVLVGSSAVTHSSNSESGTINSYNLSVDAPVSSVRFVHTGGGYQGYRLFMSAIRIYAAT